MGLGQELVRLTYGSPDPETGGSARCAGPCFVVGGMTQAAILNVMQSACIVTAELKGLRPIAVIARHALPNAIAPGVSGVMLNLAYLVVGVVVFVFPGMGQYLVDHVAKRDVPVVQACGLVFAASYTGRNIVADVVSVRANPRLRHPK